jgi:predicted ArsR family transcriptional regulator
VTERDDQLLALASLAVPLRRQLYVEVASAPDAVSRDAAAEALGIPRSVAAFHLDKLAAAGLLDIDYRRPPGRGGPGAGRPAKLYRVAERDVAVSVPERHYEVAASLLAEAIADAEERSVPVQAALTDAARELGRRIGSDRATDEARGRDLSDLAELLERRGYAPRLVGAELELGNCPFRTLAESHRELVCGMNHALVAGIIEGMGTAELTARLEPGAHRCCVTAARAG